MFLILCGTHLAFAVRYTYENLFREDSSHKAVGYWSDEVALWVLKARVDQHHAAGARAVQYQRHRRCQHGGRPRQRRPPGNLRVLACSPSGTTANRLTAVHAASVRVVAHLEARQHIFRNTLVSMAAGIVALEGTLRKLALDDGNGYSLPRQRTAPFTRDYSLCIRRRPRRALPLLPRGEAAVLAGQDAAPRQYRDAANATRGCGVVRRQPAAGSPA